MRPNNRPANSNAGTRTPNPADLGELWAGTDGIAFYRITDGSPQAVALGFVVVNTRPDPYPPSGGNVTYKPKSEYWIWTVPAAQEWPSVFALTPCVAEPSPLPPPGIRFAHATFPVATSTPAPTGSAYEVTVGEKPVAWMRRTTKGHLQWWNTDSGLIGGENLIIRFETKAVPTSTQVYRYLEEEPVSA